MRTTKTGDRFSRLLTRFMNNSSSLHQNQSHQNSLSDFDPLQPLRRWLDNIEIRNPKVARLISKLIPAQCPFERDVKVFGYKVGHIPPLCKLNPLYDQLIGLRFRSLCYLVDECGEDIQAYC